MFQRGPEPGDKPKDRVLALDPGAVCRKQFKMDLHYCEVTLSNGVTLAAGNASMAWGRAEVHLTRSTPYAPTGGK